jgi:hypothetical protein
MEAAAALGIAHAARRDAEVRGHLLREEARSEAAEVQRLAECEAAQRERHSVELAEQAGRTKALRRRLHDHHARHEGDLADGRAQEVELQRLRSELDDFEAAAGARRRRVYARLHVRLTQLTEHKQHVERNLASLAAFCKLKLDGMATMRREVRTPILTTPHPTPRPARRLCFAPCRTHTHTTPPPFSLTHTHTTRTHTTRAPRRWRSGSSRCTAAASPRSPGSIGRRGAAR